ncbi:m-AAA protease-interacting protein 1, mitochondrial [Dunckerocampus dactyliophorus]|uniref:m-AAA protease-interacting protein 1, mitochondrial n=1 Tax=Dunckerocampus dactyliophorus TaxID=161453 RepID=UPI00240686FE|nr:m-AAA protease-interacting protein 1, mitochondrial [Dunckerocampus dactyliophorus]
MLRIRRLAACRELTVSSHGIRGWRSRLYRPGVTGVCRWVFSRLEQVADARRRFMFWGQNQRMFCSQPGAEDPGGESSGRQPDISVVGIPDPLTWIRCKVIFFLLELYFDLDVNSEDFERGVKQAVVHVSSLMSKGKYFQLIGVVSTEMIRYIEEKCQPLSERQRQHLSVSMEDILFVLPEDVSVVYDADGRKFCIVVMRLWHLSSHEGPDDPEGSRIFQVAPSRDGVPQKKIATAVYEFHRELTCSASLGWTVTTVWHWTWNPSQSE